MTENLPAPAPDDSGEFILTGIVTSDRGLPVAGAEISLGPMGYMSTLHTRTDAKGQYSFKFKRVEKNVLWVSHADFAPSRLEFPDETTRQDFQLDAGKPLTFLVVDDAGMPVRNAKICAGGSDSGTQWKGMTDWKGKATWPH